MSKPVVVDSGSSRCRAGFSSAEEPRSDFASAWEGAPSMERGVVTDWDAMEKVLERVYKDLNVSPDGQPILLTDSPTNPKANREKMTELVFEKFKPPKMHIAIGAVLALYSTGNLSGLVLQSGHGVTHAVPIHQGYAISDGIGRLDLAGHDLTEAFSKRCVVAKATAEAIKEKFAHVASNVDSEKKVEKSYELPDGKSIAVGSEMFEVPEALFEPSRLGVKSSCGGVHRLVYDSISKCDDAVGKDLYSKIVLSGGTTLLPGFDGRLKKEIGALVASGTTSTKIVDNLSSRVYGSWFGGSILTALATFDEKWVTKAEYEEAGAVAVHKKCV